MIQLRSQSDDAQLQAAISWIDAAPAGVGIVDMVVRRPEVGMREVMPAGVLDERMGLVGDTWAQRASSRTDDGSPHPDMQLNLMCSRVLDAVAGGDRSRWALAGDQLIVDLDLSPAGLPVGSRLQVGEEAVIEVTAQPHRGCPKFSQRFGVAALRFVNTGHGAALRYRGVNARVITGGTVRPGDTIRVTG